MSEITVIAKARARSGSEKRLEEAVKAILEPTRREQGCLKYDLHRAEDDPATFMIIERWASKELHEKHLVSPHIQELLKKLPDVLAEMPEMRVFYDA